MCSYQTAVKTLTFVSSWFSIGTGLFLVLLNVKKLFTAMPKGSCYRINLACYCLLVVSNLVMNLIFSITQWASPEKFRYGLADLHDRCLAMPDVASIIFPMIPSMVLANELNNCFRQWLTSKLPEILPQYAIPQLRAAAVLSIASAIAFKLSAAFHGSSRCRRARIAESIGLAFVAIISSLAKPTPFAPTDIAPEAQLLPCRAEAGT